MNQMGEIGEIRRAGKLISIMIEEEFFLEFIFVAKSKSVHFSSGGLPFNHRVIR